MVCQFLSTAQFIETQTTNSAFLWYRPERDKLLFCLLRIPSTWTKERVPILSLNSPIIVRNDLRHPLPQSADVSVGLSRTPQTWVRFPLSQSADVSVGLSRTPQTWDHFPLSQSADVSVILSRTPQTWVRFPLSQWIFFPGRFTLVTSTWLLQWLPRQTPGIMESALGLVCPVSAYCDWVE